MKTRKLAKGDSGQALVETALMMPIIILMMLNAVNFGYYYLVALDLTSAARTGALYSMIGSATPAGTALPTAAGTSNLTASYLTYQDLTGSLLSPGNATVQVCSAALGTTGSGSAQTAQCETCTTSACTGLTVGSGSPTPDSDPEAPTFVLNRVDVTYTFSPIIPGTPFGLFLLNACPASKCTFGRHLSMRAMGS
jgi:Flp pilus assembly protein TadG